MDLHKSIGLPPLSASLEPRQILQFINLKLAALGVPTAETTGDGQWNAIMEALLPRRRETDRLLAWYLCPADQRVQNFLDAYLKDVPECPRLPNRTFVLERHGLARALSLPANDDKFQSAIVSSYRVHQGVLHNPAKDRRTTEGVFHVAEGGLPIPDDKRAVPKSTFARMLGRALTPPLELMQLPFTSQQSEQAACWISLLLRPVVCPEVAGYTAQKSMEVRFFAPGNLVGNLDFVESIFGNAGDPFLPENDAGLDTEHWSGHSGCVILAPHLVTMTKVEAGLPPFEEATERQKRDGMCWRDPAELYNGGQAFKLTARDERGVIVTLIADNYFGYCKKEVKTQISYAANLLGYCEEEHAGGAMVYPSYDMGETFSGHLHVPRVDHTWDEVLQKYGAAMDVQPEGYGIDRQFSDIIYVREDVIFDLHRQRISWEVDGEPVSIKLLADKIYVRPSGYKVRLEKPPGGRAWRLVGSHSEGTLCHKPSTVSGGGKSELSKSLDDAIIQGPVFIANFEQDFDLVQELIERGYSDRFSEEWMARNPDYSDSRRVLSEERSLGSVIKLLTPQPDYSKAYNDWLNSIPQHIKELVFVVKRFYRPQWGDNWREHFSVDVINGHSGNELRFNSNKLVTNYLRIGYETDGSWRTFGLRKDFHPAFKRSLEDDITASVVVPTEKLEGFQAARPAVKFVHNCEYRLFQRPDEAIHPGYDKQTEADMAAPDNFLSNFEPLTPEDARELIEDAIGFDRFTQPMHDLIEEMASGDSQYFVCSAQPRIVDGKPSKNPRYLQTRTALLQPRDVYLCEMATRMQRRLPLSAPVYTPVDAVLPGRRNNPPEPELNIPPLAVFNPIHYMPLPELFMEFICSMTGKSPSTTGAGSEGALTKGPFNALRPIRDLNIALLSYLLTGSEAFVTAAGYVGPQVRVDHDISLLAPELWSRMSPQERDPQFLMQKGYLEKCEDFEHEGRTVRASLLGYRVTRRFVGVFFGRIFNHPNSVCSEEMLRPELQDKTIFAAALETIVTTQRRVAKHYFDDGGIEEACPPLKALLHIMLYDEYEGKGLDHPDIRALFTRENMLASEWFAEFTRTRQENDIALWQRHVWYLENFLTKPDYAEEATRLGLHDRLTQARAMLERVQSDEYLQERYGVNAPR